MAISLSISLSSTKLVSAGSETIGCGGVGVSKSISGDKTPGSSSLERYRAEWDTTGTCSSGSGVGSWGGGDGG